MSRVNDLWEGEKDLSALQKASKQRDECVEFNA